MNNAQGFYMVSVHIYLKIYIIYIYIHIYLIWIICKVKSCFGEHKLQYFWGEPQENDKRNKFCKMKIIIFNNKYIKTNK